MILMSHFTWPENPSSCRETSSIIRDGALQKHHLFHRAAGEDPELQLWLNLMHIQYDFFPVNTSSHGRAQASLERRVMSFHLIYASPRCDEYFMSKFTFGVTLLKDGAHRYLRPMLQWICRKTIGGNSPHGWTGQTTQPTTVRLVFGMMYSVLLDIIHHLYVFLSDFKRPVCAYRALFSHRFPRLLFRCFILCSNKNKFCCGPCNGLESDPDSDLHFGFRNWKYPLTSDISPPFHSLWRARTHTHKHTHTHTHAIKQPVLALAMEKTGIMAGLHNAFTMA